LLDWRVAYRINQSRRSDAPGVASDIIGQGGVIKQLFAAMFICGHCPLEFDKALVEYLVNRRARG